MRQKTLADEGFERYRKPTHRDQFLAEMDQVLPWSDLCKVIKPFYLKPKGAGRPPLGLERMLRIHFPHQWFNLSDPAVEETLYDSRAMRRFVGIHRYPGIFQRRIYPRAKELERENLAGEFRGNIQSHLLTSTQITAPVRYKRL